MVSSLSDFFPFSQRARASLIFSLVRCLQPPRVHPVTVDNYDPELVLNPDDAKETNFAVYADNEIIIGSSEPALRLLCGS